MQTQIQVPSHRRAGSKQENWWIEEVYCVSLPSLFQTTLMFPTTASHMWAITKQSFLDSRGITQHSTLDPRELSQVNAVVWLCSRVFPRPSPVWSKGVCKVPDVCRHIKNCNQRRQWIPGTGTRHSTHGAFGLISLVDCMAFYKKLGRCFSHNRLHYGEELTSDQTQTPNDSYLLGLTLLRKATCPAQSSNLTTWLKAHWPQANYRSNQMNLLDADSSKQHSIFGTNIHQQLFCSVLFLHVLSLIQSQMQTWMQGTMASPVFQPVNSWHHLYASSPASFAYTREAQTLQRRVVCHRKLLWKKLYTAMCLTKPSSFQNALLSLSMQE